MSSKPTSKPDRETMWQRTCGVFPGDRVRLKLRGGRYLEGELKDPGPYAVTLVQLAGTERRIDYSDLLGVEATK